MESTRAYIEARECGGNFIIDNGTISKICWYLLLLIRVCCFSLSLYPFHVNKEAILLSIQIIKIFIFLFVASHSKKPFLFTASKVYCTSGSYNNGYKYTYYITMGSNEKFRLCHSTRFHPFLGLLMNLHRVISLMCWNYTTKAKKCLQLWHIQRPIGIL